jgi:8-oxo-dGTP pyrophosphatase MutT (NUDIX family)
MCAIGADGMTGRYTTWDGQGDEAVSVPRFAGENLMVPVIRAVVRSVDRPGHILLQRRDDPTESVRGALEIPGGRWRAGESPIDAITREVEEETGIVVVDLIGIELDRIDERRAVASIHPLVVVAGVHGAFPAVHTVIVARGTGEPRSQAGESTDVRWWPLEAVVREMDHDGDAFIPSTVAALRAYVGWLDSTEA